MLLLVGGGVYLVARDRPPEGRPRWLPLSGSVPGEASQTAPAGAFTFKDASGQSIAYLPAGTSQRGASWATFDARQGGYSVEYPASWVKVDRADHGGFTVYAPGTNPDEQIPGGPKGVSVTWSDAYRPPDSSDRSIADLRSVTSGGVTGQLYTVGVLGKSIIAAFPRNGGYLLLQADLSGVVTAEIEQDAATVDVFQRMLASLKLY